MKLSEYKCPLCGHELKDKRDKRLYLMCNVKGYEKPIFVCGKCYTKNIVISRVRTPK